MSPLVIFAAIFSIMILVIFVREIFRHVTVKRQCPVCGNEHPDRSKRPVWAKSIHFLVASRGYQCHACGNRFIRIGQSIAKTSEEAAVH